MFRQVPRRRPRSGRSAAAITAAVLGPAALLPTLAATASARVPATFAGPGILARANPPGAAPVLLINGDRLQVQPGPAGSLHAIVKSHDSMPLMTLRIHGATYYLPADAIPYLGHGLDPSLFDIGSLERLETGGRLPVRLSYAAAVPAVPGITITRASSGTAAGYLTASSARVFGAALARQFATGHARGSYRTAGLFARVRIALAGAASPAAPIRPQYPMHTVTIKASNVWGKPDSGDLVVLFNVDNPATFGDPYEVLNVFYHGSARYSVPAGHYWAVADFLSSVRSTFSQRMVVLPQFTVSGNTTVHLAARSASSRVTFQTPRPAALQTESWTGLRYSPDGQGVPIGTTGIFGPLWISPVKAKPSVGALQSYTAGQLFSTTRKGVPYIYNLAFTAPSGIIPSQHFVVRSASLATVHERYYSGKPAQAFWATSGGNPNQLTFSLFALLNVPGLVTEYFSGGSSYIWQTFIGTSDGGGQADSLHTLMPGQDLTQNWNEYPLHPQPYYQLLTGSLARDFPEPPAAFRVGNEVWFLPVPFSDNDTRFGDNGNTEFFGSYRIMRNGRPVAGGGFGEYARARVSPRSSVITFSLATTLAQDPLRTLSSASYTVWKVRSKAEPRTEVSRSWFCVTPRFAPTRRCAVLPLLTLSYQVGGLGLTGVAPAGPQSVSVTVGHIAPAGPSPIVSAKARVSWDNGRFWQPATLTTTSAGHYLVTFDAPAGTDVTLRFTAADAAGGSITETITNAYAVAGA